MSEKFEVKDGLKIPSGKQLELAGVSLSGISNDTSLTDSSSADLVTEHAVKSYIDANNQWTITDGDGNTSTIESGDDLTISGTANEVEVAVDGDSFSVGLPASVDITTDLEVATLDFATGSIQDSTGAISFNDENLSTTGTLAAGATTVTGAISASGSLTVGTVADATSMASTAAPTDDAHIANKKYVDDQLGSTAMSAATDSGNMNPIDLDSETLSLLGGEGMNVTHDGNSVTFAGEDATSANKGVASFNATDFTVTDGAVTLAKDPVVTLDGDISGSATMTNLASATITTTIGENAVEMSMLSSGALPTDITVASANLVDATIVNADIAEGTIANSKLAGSIANDKLANDSVSFGGVSVDLGGEDATPAFDLSGATSYPGDASLATTGALASGSIASGFGNIDNGSSTLNTGAATVASLDASSGGITQAGSIAGATSVDGSGDLTMGTITMTGFTVDADGDTVVKSLSAGGLLTVGTVADATSMASTAAPTDDAHIANKKYVDDQLGASVLTFTTDTDGNNDVDLDEDTLTFAGLSGVGVTHSGDAITVALDDLNSHDTDGLSEGSTNQYYTDARARASISASLASGDGGIAYNSSTGAITMTGPSAAETQAHFSASDLGGDGSFSYADGVYTYTGPSATETRAHFSVADTDTIDMSVTDGQFSGDIKATSVTNAMLAGSIENAKLSNSSVSFGGVEVALGATDATPAFDLSGASLYPGDNSLVTTGAIDSGSITSGFGNVDIGDSTLAAGATTITGAISASGLLTVGTVADATSMASTAAPTNDAHIANKKYVDDQLGATALSGSSDSGTLEVDLDSQSFSIVGTANEIETSATGQTLTVGLPDDVTIGNDLSVTRNATVTGTLTQTAKATFAVEAEFNGGIDCDGQLSMETNDIVGTADNMLLQADDETAHDFGGNTSQLALQASSGIVFVDEVASNVVPTGTRTLGSSSARWSEMHSDEVVFEHGKTTSFSSTPGSADATAVMSFAHGDFKSAKVSMNIKSGNNYTAREVLIVCDENGANAKLVEYGIISTGSELGTLTVATNGANIELKVAAANALPCTGVVTLSE